MLFRGIYVHISTSTGRLTDPRIHHDAILVPKSPKTLCHLFATPFCRCTTTPWSGAFARTRVSTPYCWRQHLKGLFDTWSCHPFPACAFSAPPWMLAPAVGGELCGGGCWAAIARGRCGGRFFSSSWSARVFTSSRLPQSLKSCSRSVDRVSWFARRLWVRGR